MAGLYIHIPFCKSRCIYCGFYSTTHRELRQRYVDAVCREMEMRERWKELKTVYLGGGTPSQLSIGQLHQIFDAIYKYNKVEMGAEVTMEMNPDDVTEAYADALCMLPVNRVSMGAQTFDDARLKWLHRRHTSRQVAEAMERLRDNGIQNISIDLMYGFPGETLEDWQRDIDAALALGAEHISAYCLMIEEGTALHRMLHKGDGSFCVISDGITQKEPSPICDEELERQMYEMLIDKLTAAGYEHYEISNFAKPGFRSRHNSSYWQDVPYIGLGAAAHSYLNPGGRTAGHSNSDGGAGGKTAGNNNGERDGGEGAGNRSRSWNVSDIRRYMAAIEKGELPCEGEEIDDDTHYNDRITTALRTSDGLDLTTLSDKHKRYCLKEAQRFMDDGLLRLEQKGTAQCLSLTRKGLFVSDMVMSSLMLV